MTNVSNLGEKKGVGLWGDGDGVGMNHAKLEVESSVHEERRRRRPPCQVYTCPSQVQTPSLSLSASNMSGTPISVIHPTRRNRRFRQNE